MPATLQRLVSPWVTLSHRLLGKRNPSWSMLQEPTWPPRAHSLSFPPRQHQFILGIAASGDSLFPGWQVPENVSLVVAIIARWCSGYYIADCWFVLYWTINIHTELTMHINSVQQVVGAYFKLLRKICHSLSVLVSLSLYLFIVLFYTTLPMLF